MTTIQHEHLLKSTSTRLPGDDCLYRALAIRVSCPTCREHEEQIVDLERLTVLFAGNEPALAAEVRAIADDLTRRLVSRLHLRSKTWRRERAALAWSRYRARRTGSVLRALD